MGYGTARDYIQQLSHQRLHDMEAELKLHTGLMVSQTSKAPFQQLVGEEKGGFVTFLSFLSQKGWKNSLAQPTNALK